MRGRWGKVRWGVARWWGRVTGAPLSIDDRTFAATWEDDRTFAMKSFTMTKTSVNLTNFVIGDSKRVRRTYTDLPEGSTVATAYLTIKKSEKQSDAAAIVQKPITITQTSNGQITDALSNGGSIAMFFDLSKTDTAKFKAGVEYVYDIQIVLSGGEVHTMEVGTITWINGVTAATS